MADPTPYTPTYDFSDYQATNPSKPLPGDQVDIEFHNVSDSLTSVIAAVQDIRRSDGALKNGIVTADSLSPDALAALGPNGDLVASAVAEAEADAVAAAASAAAAAASAATAVLNGGTSFASRADLIAATIAAPVMTVSWLDGGVFLVGKRDALGTAVTSNGGTVAWSPANGPFFEHWGAQGDGATDDAAAMQAAITYAKTYGAMIQRGAPGKIYRFNSALDCSLASGTNTRWGMDMTGALLQQNFTGHGLVGMDFSRAGARCGGIVRLQGLRIQNGAAAVDPPIMMDISGAANFTLRDIHFEGSTNKQLQMDSLYNTRMDLVTAYYGGRYFPWKNASGVTFSITSGTNTLTCSPAHFAAGDVGRVISLENASTGRREFYTISAFGTTSSVTVSGNSGATFTGVVGNWEHARVTVTGATATILGENWPTDCAGLDIYIAGAAADAMPQRRRIASRDSDTVVTLDSAVSTNVVGARFVCPAVDMGSETFYAGPGASSGESNDVKIYNLWIENPRGAGIVINDLTDGYFYTAKIHGEAQPDGNTLATANHAWLIKAQMEAAGTELHADNVSGAKIVSFGLQGKTYFSGHTRAQIGIAQNFAEHVSTDTGGLIDVDSLEVIGTVAKLTELTAEAVAAGGKTLFGSLSQVGLAPVFLPRTPWGVRVVTTDATETHTYGYAQANTIIHSGTLTAARNFNFASVVGGGRQRNETTIRITRTGGGAFNLNVRDGASATTLKALATGQWCDITWRDTAWYLSAAGSL